MRGGDEGQDAFVPPVSSTFRPVFPGNPRRSEAFSLKVIRHSADAETTSSWNEFSGGSGFPEWGDPPEELRSRPFSQEGLRVMSHDDAANRSATWSFAAPGELPGHDGRPRGTRPAVGGTSAAQGGPRDRAARAPSQGPCESAGPPPRRQLARLAQAPDDQRHAGDQLSTSAGEPAPRRPRPRPPPRGPGRPPSTTSSSSTGQAWPALVSPSTPTPTPTATPTTDSDADRRLRRQPRLPARRRRPLRRRHRPRRPRPRQRRPRRPPRRRLPPPRRPRLHPRPCPRPSPTARSWSTRRPASSTSTAARSVT